MTKQEKATQKGKFHMLLVENTKIVVEHVILNLKDMDETTYINM